MKNNRDMERLIEATRRVNNNELISYAEYVSGVI